MIDFQPMSSSEIHWTRFEIMPEVSIPINNVNHSTFFLSFLQLTTYLADINTVIQTV